VHFSKVFDATALETLGLLLGFEEGVLIFYDGTGKSIEFCLKYFVQDEGTLVVFWLALLQKVGA
jgi:hypothetical protein